jgi:hypothetical protein
MQPEGLLVNPQVCHLQFRLQTVYRLTIWRRVKVRVGLLRAIAAEVRVVDNDLPCDNERT